MAKKTAVTPNDEGELCSALALAPDFDLDRVRTAVNGIRYGEVRLIIQDGVIVQIERLEKQRLR